MKKTCKKLMAMMMTAAVLVVTALPVSADYYAEQIVPEKMTVTLYSAQSVKNRFSNETYLGYISGKKLSVKSSSPKIATAKVKNGSITVKAKKTGKTKITVKKGSKKYVCDLTVAKYANPISSVKVGKTTISGKKFNKNAYVNLKYAKYANKKSSIKFKLKKGWKLIFVDYGKKNWQKGENFKNGAKIKVTGGAGFVVSAYVMNTATGQTEFIMINFK
nr:hypothetical protein [uncultured Blautia sp.]